MRSGKKGSIRRTIQYRRLFDPSGMLSGSTLEDKLREALSPNHHMNVGNDVEDRSMVGNKTYALNTFEHRGSLLPDGGHFFGEVFSYEPGATLSYIEHKSNAKMLSFFEADPGEGKSWLESIMYFLVKGNNVLAVQSGNVRFTELQNYLNWLLCLHTKVCAEDFKIILNEKADASVTGSDYEKVRGIHIKDPNSIRKSNDLFDDEFTRLRFDSQMIRDVPWSLMELIMKKIGNREGSAEIDYKKLSEKYALRADLRFRIEKPSGPENREDVSNLVDFLMQLPDDFVELELPEGTISNGKLKLIATEDIPTVPGSSRLEPEGAAKALHGVYTSWAANKRIPPR